MDENYLVTAFVGGKCVYIEYHDNLDGLNRRFRKGTEIVVMDMRGLSSATMQDKVNQWQRPVQCVETGMVFDSIRDCSEFYGVPYKSIWNAVRSGKAREGFHFRLM